MSRTVELNDVVSPALRLKHAGYVHTQTDFKIGPRKIAEFGFAFLHSGKGSVIQSGVRHTLTGGELFLIFPHTRYVMAAANSRWKVYWGNFVAPALAAALRLAEITPRRYLRRNCDRERLKQICESLISAGIAGPSQNMPEAAARIWDLLALLQPSRPRQTRKVASPIDTARRYLEKHPTMPIRVVELAAMSHLSRFHFIRLFRRETGFSPHQYQINQRLQVARRMLTSGKTVKETALALDYTDLFYFSRLFKRKTGVAPSQYVHGGLL
jgi:AraC-like DNA-binding protein